MLATSLLLLCGISDVADGYIARRFRQQSALGSILDPLGDKLLVGVLAGALVWKGLVPVWLVSMILARDFGLVTSGIYVRWKNLPSPVTWAKFVDPATATATVTPTTISKINTALQIILLGLSLTSPMLVDAYGSVVEPLLVALQYTVAVTTIWSSISYIRNFRRVIRFIKK
jgi:cardiolipin synthase